MYYSTCLSTGDAKWPTLGGCGPLTVGVRMCIYMYVGYILVNFKPIAATMEEEKKESNGGAFMMVAGQN